MKKLLVFSNCHGERYLQMMKRDSSILDYFEVDIILSYTQLDNFEEHKHKFQQADLVLVNNIKNYNDFTLSNLRKIMKPDVLLIVIPFVRFNGYWPDTPTTLLSKIGSGVVQDFPRVGRRTARGYLDSSVPKAAVNAHFDRAVEKLRVIERESDIEFVNFFLDNHAKYPMFRDYLHPTVNMLEHVGAQIVSIVSRHYDIPTAGRGAVLSEAPREGGHFKPIVNAVKSCLGLTYDLDAVYLCSRETFIKGVLEYEASDGPALNDLGAFHELLRVEKNKQESAESEARAAEQDLLKALDEEEKNNDKPGAAAKKKKQAADGSAK